VNTERTNPEGIERVAIVFSGGPAPAANAVISSVVTAFLKDGREVLGIFHGYSNLQGYEPESGSLVEGEHYRHFGPADISGLRNSRGIIIGTARANPGKGIESMEDLNDPVKTERLRNVYEALRSLGVDAVVSIGGDDTLKTANLLYLFQENLSDTEKRIRVVHVPKTIDNDYRGIDFTFGFFTAVDVMAKELLNLRSDAQSTSSYFVVETMGRKAAWLSYGVAIAGEAAFVLGVEDIDDSLLEPGTKELSLERMSDRLVDLILKREQEGEHFGTIVLAEGLAARLPASMISSLARDEHGHLSLGKIDLGKLVAFHVAARYEKRTGSIKKIKGLQLGYESRCAPPHAFDVMLGSQLGIGAYRALVEHERDGEMVSVSGQLDLEYVPFAELIDPETLKTEVRYIRPGSDYHKLARFLETRLDMHSRWNLTRRRESSS